MPVATLSSGVDVYHEVVGSGDPLLLVMGTAADPSSWDVHVEAYKDHYSVITYAARGTGPPTNPEYSSPYLRGRP